MPTKTLQKTSKSSPPMTSERILDAEWLRQLCLDAGADDVGFVEIEREELSDQRDDLLAVFPRTRTLVSFVCRMNREPIRSPARSVANLEFHHTGDHVNEVAHRIVRILEREAVKAIIRAVMKPQGKSGIVPHFPEIECRNE